MVSIVTGFNNGMVRPASRASARPWCSSRSSSRVRPGRHRSDEREEPQGPDARGRPRAEGPDPEMPRGLAGALPLGHRRQRRSTGARRPPTRRVAGVDPDYSLANNHFVEHGRFFTDVGHRSTRRRRRHRPDVQKALFPQRDPLGKPSSSNGWQVHGHRRPRAKGDFGGGSRQPLVPHPVHDLRPPVPADQERPRRHDPHRDRAEQPEQVPVARSRRGARSCAPAARCRFDKPRTTSPSSRPTR